MVNPLISCGQLHGVPKRSAEPVLHLAPSRHGPHPGVLRGVRHPARITGVRVPDDFPDHRAIVTEPLANIVHMFRIAAPAPSSAWGSWAAARWGRWPCSRRSAPGRPRNRGAGVTVRYGSKPHARWARPSRSMSLRRKARRGPALCGERARLVLDASGSGPARQAAFDLCRPGGLVVLLGMGSERSEWISSPPSARNTASPCRSPIRQWISSVPFLCSKPRDRSDPWTVEEASRGGQQAFER